MGIEYGLLCGIKPGVAIQPERMTRTVIPRQSPGHLPIEIGASSSSRATELSYRVWVRTPARVPHSRIYDGTQV